MKVLRRISYLLNQRQIDADLTEELDHHRHLSTDRAMGNMEQALQTSRRVWMGPWLRLTAFPRPGRALRRLVRNVAARAPRLSPSTLASLGVFFAILFSWRLLTGTPLTWRTEITLAAFYFAITVIEAIRRVQQGRGLEPKSTPPQRRFVEDSKTILDLAKLSGYDAVRRFTPYLGKWMTIAGAFDGVAETLQRDALHMSLRLDDGRRLNLRFSLDGRDRLARLKEGQRVTAIGQIQHVSFTLTLENCELVRVESIRPSRRLILAS